MRRILLLAIIAVSALAQFPSWAQIVSPDSAVIRRKNVLREFDSRPYFGLYKDNYFLFGTTVGHKPTRSNTNVKFQVSISQKLTRTTLPFGTYLYLFYTQKVFWNILEDSMPMTDLNFNPGIGLTKPLFSHDRYIGKVSLILETRAMDATAYGRVRGNGCRWPQTYSSTTI